MSEIEVTEKKMRRWRRRKRRCVVELLRFYSLSLSVGVFPFNLIN